MKINPDLKNAVIKQEEVIRSLLSDWCIADLSSCCSILFLSLSLSFFLCFFLPLFPFLSLCVFLARPNLFFSLLQQLWVDRRSQQIWKAITTGLLNMVQGPFFRFNLSFPPHRLLSSFCLFQNNGSMANFIFLSLFLLLSFSLSHQTLSYHIKPFSFSFLAPMNNFLS